MKSSQLRNLIRYALPQELYSEDVAELLVFTAAVETDGCKFNIQQGYTYEDLGTKNFGLGFFQTEGNTAIDLDKRYFARRYKDNPIYYRHPFDISMLLTDIKLMIIFARLKYLDYPKPIPKLTGNIIADTESLWGYYKVAYNSAKGASTREISIGKYQRYR